MEEWQAIKGKCLIKLIFQESVPFQKLRSQLLQLNGSDFKSASLQTSSVLVSKVFVETSIGCPILTISSCSLPKAFVLL